ncbi:MAG: diguanylate cyclase domain-containing protein [Planctomycetia bacterium]
MDAVPATDAAAHEAKRLEVLASYGIMDTPPDAVLDSIVRVASRALGAHVGLVSLLDERRQWFKARHGLDVTETPRDIAFCNTVVSTEGDLIVEDAHADPRFANNPLVTGEPHVRFYAGVPLLMPEGHVLGALCAVDTLPKKVAPEQVEQLRDLARIAVARIVSLRNDTHLEHTQAELVNHHRFFQRSMDMYAVASLEGYFVELNPRWSAVLGWTLQELCSRPFAEFVHPDDVASTAVCYKSMTQQEDVVRFRNRYRCKDGSYVWLEWNALAPAPWENRCFASARDVTHVVEAEQALVRQNGLLALISDSQSRLVSEGPSREWWTYVLKRLLDLTASEYGFIGETDEDAEGKFLRTKSITNIAWDDATRALYAAQAPTGFMFRNLKTLFGSVLVTEARVVANDVPHDPRAGGRPPGHPPLNAFAGLPLRDGARMIGMVGLANRAGGFHSDILDPLEPVLAFLGSVLKSLRLEDERQQFVQRLETAKELQQRVLESSESGFVALRADGSLGLTNSRARDLLPTLAALPVSGSPPGLATALSILFPQPEQRDWIAATLAAEEGARVGPRQLQAAARPAPGPAAAPAGSSAPAEAGDREQVPMEVIALRIRAAEGVAPGVLITLTDLRPRESLRESLRLNAALEERVSQLHSHQQHNAVLSECVEYLQGCTTLAEGLELVARSVERLFPSANTALYGSLQPSAPMSLMRHARRFSGPEPHEDLAPAQCWALRSRRPYGSWPGSHHLACPHLGNEPAGASLCVPLFSLDRNVAVFLVAFPPEKLGEDALGQDARLSQFVAMGQSISGALSTIALRESLQRMALTDELTGLANRRAFVQEVTRALARSRRSKSPFGLAVLDIDHFKQVNDTFGHDAGDQVLRDVATVLRRSLREGDLVARTGGEEFALFLPDLREDASVPRLELLLASLRSACAVGGRPITASVGVVHSADVPETTSYDGLYRLADEAMYVAKTSGRDRVVRAGATRAGDPTSA